jgi:hypothetical protein
MADDFSTFVQGGLQEAPGLYKQAQGALQRATSAGDGAYNEAINTIRGLGQTNQGAPLMALAAQMFAPTKTGGFGESLGGGLSAYGNAITQQRAETMDRAQKLAALQLAQAKMQQDGAMGIWNMNKDRLGMGATGVEVAGNISDYERIRRNTAGGAAPPTPGGMRDAQAGVPGASGVPASGLPAVAGGMPGQTPLAGAGGAPMPLGGPQGAPPAGVSPMGTPPARPPQQESGPIPPQGRKGVVDISRIPAAQADLRVIQDYRANPGLYQGPKGAALYKQAQENLQKMISEGVAVDENGVVGAIAGSLKDPEHEGRVAAEKERNVQREQAPYKFEEGIDPRTGAKFKFSLSQLAGAGTPFMTADPKDTDERLSQAAKSEEKMTENFQHRQIVRERMEKLRSISQGLQQGAFATNKAALLAAAKSIGIPLSKEAAERPALVQQWLKDSTANVFDQAKALGGRILLAEIQGLKEANPNPNLEPGANAALISQGLGLLDYEDQYHKDYFGWRKENRRNPYVDEFANDWIAKNPPTKFVNAQNKQGTALGTGLPEFKDLVDGQAYMIGKQPHTWNAAAKQFIPK